MKDEQARLHVHIPRALHTALKKRAADEGVPMNDIVARVLRRLLEKKK